MFKIKNRSLDKPVSVLIKDFEELKKYSNLNDEQINFLKSYPYPFTILTKPNKEFVLPDFLDGNVYSKIAFRIWKLAIEKEILKKIELPFFLTSANISNEKELYNSKEVEEAFVEHIEDVTIISWQIPKAKPSDIFEFDWETLNLKYLRKNY